MVLHLCVANKMLIVEKACYFLLKALKQKVKNSYVLLKNCITKTKSRGNLLNYN